MRHSDIQINAIEGQAYIEVRGDMNEFSENAMKELSDTNFSTYFFDFSQLNEINCSGVRLIINFLRSLEEHVKVFYEKCNNDLLNYIHDLPIMQKQASILSVAS